MRLEGSRQAARHHSMATLRAVFSEICANLARSCITYSGLGFGESGHIWKGVDGALPGGVIGVVT